jgi:hypothetical protein
MPIVLKSGSLSLLEPSGPLLACNGIALPFPFNKNRAADFIEKNIEKNNLILRA